MEILLEVHGSYFAIEGDTDAVSELGLLFGGFRRPVMKTTTELHLVIERGEPRLPKLSRRPAERVMRRGLIYRDGSTTYVDHHGRAISQFDFTAKRGRIRGAETADLVELGYLLLHSRIGAALDRANLFRVHAAGFSLDGQSALILGPSGVGKSTLALSLLRHERVCLLGDDTVLVDREGRAHTFPVAPLVRDGFTVSPADGVRIVREASFANQSIVDIDHLTQRFARSPVPIRLIAFATRVSAPPSKFIPLTARYSIPALLRNMVIAVDLPQVIEFFTRRGHRGTLTVGPVLARRTRSALTLARRAQSAKLEIADPNSAADLLVSAISEMGLPSGSE